ncbi:DUF1569 domain-containing protein [Flavobacterium sp.]|uniref:DUF1569 domain-containing protein n=1 Tax=Flavobacterium sp. TaxID=239 RepID=UPI002FDA0650
MTQLNQLLNTLESKISLHEKTNLCVSNATIGWQIEHSLKTILEVVKATKNSNPANYKWKFNFNKFLVYTINFIPRGRGKAPKIVRPEGTITIKSLHDSLENVRASLLDWDTLDNNAYFAHPYFGDVNKKSTEKFLILHTKHHLKIINDICTQK